MADVTAPLAASRAAAEQVADATEAARDRWTTPRAPGKWSPSQVVEHIARALEAAANDVQGEPSNLPNLPGPLRWLARVLLFNRVITKGAFPKARTSKGMDPLEGPPTPEAGRARVTAAHEAFDAACRSLDPETEHITTCSFGSVALVDYIRFNELHTRHHLRQMAPGS